MTNDYTKGGRGKSAPYKTTHCRVPSEIKELVDQLSILYRKSYDDKDTPAIKELMDSLQKVIDIATKKEKPCNTDNLDEVMAGNNNISEDGDDEDYYVLEASRAIEIARLLWKIPSSNKIKVEKLLTAIYKERIKIW